MRMKRSIAAAALAVCFSGLLGALPAKAMTFNFSYSGEGVSGFGTFTGNYIGGNEYILTSITGSETDGSNTHTITGLSSYAGSDNLLYYPGPTYVDFGGISFFTANNPEAWNIYFNSYTGLLDYLSNPVGYPNSLRISFVVSETPLPSTWLMLLSGFVGLGFFAYRGTKKNSAALAAA